MREPREEITVWEQVAVGRGVLATGAPLVVSPERLVCANSPVAALLALLWHEELSLQRAAALALAGGDLVSAYTPAYGHFAGTFLRVLANQAEQRPEGGQAQYLAVTGALRHMLTLSAGEIQAMSNMNYSFLSSALYLALLSTCQDMVEAVRRLRIATAHTELCGLLRSLTQASVVRRLNTLDLDLIAQTIHRALAALPANELTDFWNALTHAYIPQRLAVAPALAHFCDQRAAPYLIEMLPNQPASIAEWIIPCLGRLGDIRALPVLERFAEGKERLLRGLAQSAMSAIRRANAENPQNTLLRSAREVPDTDPGTLLRSVRSSGKPEPPEQLLRVHERRG